MLTMVDSEHSHSFGQERVRFGARRALMVIALTLGMMVIEVFAGWLFGSMALLADGLHMASHSVALSITAMAYVYARKHAHDDRFSFGTGKVNSLAGFASALILALFSLFMVNESVSRLIHPVEIVFDHAILVAIIGLIVNAVSFFLLKPSQADDQHGHAHSDSQHGHAHSDSQHGHHAHDHNLRAATLHVLADALTSLLAIFALLAGKYFSQVWMDPFMGLVGAALVAKWSIGLMRDSAWVLLDRRAPESVRNKILEAFSEVEDTRVADFHVWSIGPNIYALEICAVAKDPMKASDHKKLLPQGLGVVHATVEVCQSN